MNIGHLLKDIHLRSEDVGAGLYERDVDGPYSPLDLVHAISTRDHSGLLKSLKRHYLAGSIQARKDFFTKVLDGAGDVVDGAVNGAEDVVSGAAVGFDALGNGIKNAVNQRDYLAGYIQARNFFSGLVDDASNEFTSGSIGFDDLGNTGSTAVSSRDYLAGSVQARKDFFTKVLDGAGDVADGVVNDAEDAVTGAAEGIDALGNGIVNAVNQRDYLAGSIQARKSFFTKVLDGAGDVVDGAVNGAEDAVTGAAVGFDALGNSIENAVNQ